LTATSVNSYESYFGSDAGERQRSREERHVASVAGHNAETLPEIWSEGAAPFKGDFSKDVVLTVEKDGVYGVKSLPHYGMGMMALIVAGKLVNADQVKAFKPPAPAAKRFEAIAGNLK